MGGKFCPLWLPLLLYVGVGFLCPTLPWGVQVALASMEPQQGETCACGCRPVSGKLAILDMEIIKAKWEARLSYFHADTGVAFLLFSQTRHGWSEWDQEETICM